METFLSFPQKFCDNVGKSWHSKIVVVAVATVRENRNVTLVVTKYYRHHDIVESKYVSQTPHSTRPRFCPSGCAFALRCHRPGLEPRRRRPSEKIVVAC